MNGCDETIGQAEIGNQKFLREGPQTKITVEIREVAKSFKKEGLELVKEILDWMRKNFRHKKDDSIAFARTAEEIIRSRFFTGCQDLGIVFVTFLRAKGIPASYIEAKKKTGKFHGHVFSRVFLNNKIYFVDPTRKTVSEVENFGNYFPIKEGLDSWDLGVRSVKDIKTLLSKVHIKS